MAAPGRTASELTDPLLAGDKRALARAISLVENDDPEGWALVREVYPRTGKASVLILGTYRPADSVIEGHPIRRLHQDLEIHERCSELPLDRLSRIEVERYLALRFADDALASILSEPVFERSQGQPLFMASLLKYYIDHRAIIETDDGWQLSSAAAIAQDSVPNDLVNMITYQVARLTEQERRLLDIASVAGGEFSAALVAAGLSGDPIEVERDLDALARLGVVLRHRDR